MERLSLRASKRLNILHLGPDENKNRLPASKSTEVKGSLS